MLKEISSAFLHLTNACNCHCLYCFEEHNPQYMTYQTAKDAVDFLIKNSKINKDVPGIVFFGGEPLLCWESIIVPLTNYIRKDYKGSFNLSITTNGTLLDEKKLKFMKKNNIGLLFSIDGDKQTQDYNRPLNNGKSSFDALKNIISIIPQYFPNTTFRSTIIPKTVGQTFHNILFAEKNGYKNFFVVPNCFEEWQEEEKEILSKEMRKYSDYMIDCFQKEKNPIFFSGYNKNFANINKINNAILKNEYRKNVKCNNCQKCGLGASKSAAIGVKGEIYGCQELACYNQDIQNIFFIGDIYHGIDDERRIKLINSFSGYINHQDEKKCQSCKLNRICDGGCVANNYLYNKDINIMPPICCWWEQLLLEETIYICNGFGEKIPNTFLNYWREKTRYEK